MNKEDNKIKNKNDWVITDKASDKLKMLQEITSSRTAELCKNDFQ